MLEKFSYVHTWHYEAYFKSLKRVKATFAGFCAGFNDNRKAIFVSDNLWHTGNVTDISRSGIGWLDRLICAKISIV